MKYVFIFLTVFTCNLCQGQEKPQAALRVTDSLNATDLYRVMSLLGIDIQKYSLGEEYKGYFCNLIIEEYLEGKLVQSFEARKSIGKLNEFVLDIGFNLQNGWFPISIYSQDLPASLKVKTHVGEMEHQITFAKQANLAYTWKNIAQPGNMRITPMEKYAFVAYTSPVGPQYAKTEGASEFCLINGETIKAEDWFKKLAVRHSFIFYLKLEK